MILMLPTHGSQPLHAQAPGGQAAGRGQAVHTASDIPVSAYSSGSRVDQQFTGVQTNTDIFFKLMRAALTASADRD